jgi:hypothetical protein
VWEEQRHSLLTPWPCSPHRLSKAVSNGLQVVSHTVFEADAARVDTGAYGQLLHAGGEDELEPGATLAKGIVAAVWA